VPDLAVQDRAHPVERLDADDVDTRLEERLGQPASAGADIDDPCPTGCVRNHRHDVRRVVGPAALVGVGRQVEAARQGEHPASVGHGEPTAVLARATDIATTDAGYDPVEPVQSGGSVSRRSPT
jgi:hypothetical protein